MLVDLDIGETCLYYKLALKDLYINKLQKYNQI